MKYRLLLAVGRRLLRLEYRLNEYRWRRMDPFDAACAKARYRNR